MKYAPNSSVQRQISSRICPIIYRKSHLECNVRIVVYGKLEWNRLHWSIISSPFFSSSSRYKNVETLRTHSQRHKDNDRQHICHFENCSKQCTTSSSLSAHIRYVHLKIKDFECSVCKKKFRRKLELTEHMARHTGQVLYNCQFCPKTFTSSSNYFSHRKYRHPIQLAESKTKKDEWVMVLWSDTWNSVLSRSRTALSIFKTTMKLLSLSTTLSLSIILSRSHFIVVTYTVSGSAFQLLKWSEVWYFE